MTSFDGTFGTQLGLSNLEQVSIASCLEPLRPSFVGESDENTNYEQLMDPGVSHETRGGGRRQKSKRPEKPPISYIALIYMAIEHQPTQRATLTEIYSFLTSFDSFFKGSYVGWKNSIRHNLSLNECFIKLPKKEGGKTGKGHYWAIDENAKCLLEEGCLKRRPRGYKNKLGSAGGASGSSHGDSPSRDLDESLKNEDLNSQMIAANRGCSSHELLQHSDSVQGGHPFLSDPQSLSFYPESAHLDYIQQQQQQQQQLLWYHSNGHLVDPHMHTASSACSTAVMDPSWTGTGAASVNSLDLNAPTSMHPEFAPDPYYQCYPEAMANGGYFYDDRNHVIYSTYPSSDAEFAENQEFPQPYFDPRTLIQSHHPQPPKHEVI